MQTRPVRLYYFLMFVKNLGAAFSVATYVMFLLSRGLNLLQINLVNFVFFTTLFVCEVPTGVVADVFGRKLSFALSCFVYAAGMFLYAGSNSFFGFAAAEATAAVGATLASGAFEAWLVDSLKHRGDGRALAPVFARGEQIRHGTWILGALGGSFVAQWNLVFPWIVGGSVMLIAGMLTILLMREEYFVRRTWSWRRGWNSMHTTTVQSLRFVRSSSVVHFLIVMGIVQLFAVQAPNMQWQPFFGKFFSAKIAFGVLFTGISLSLFAGSALAPRFLRRMRSDRRAILAAQGAIGVGLLLAALVQPLVLILPAFLFHEMCRGLFNPLKSAYLNAHIPSAERATIISFDTMAHHVGGMVGLLVSGLVAHYGSIPLAWGMSGFSLLAATLLIARNGKKKSL